MKKIVVIGPESTGKSTLCEELANHYGTLWCAEYAREYLLKHGMNYNYETLITIAMGQLKLEEVCTARAEQLSKDLLIVDTDMYVMKVWCEFVFGKCHQFILEEIVARKYDLYLLCNVDLPWVKDELREYPDLENREKLYHIYKDLMINQSTPWVDISGSGEERLQTAIRSINEIL